MSHVQCNSIVFDCTWENKIIHTGPGAPRLRPARHDRAPSAKKRASRKLRVKLR